MIVVVPADTPLKKPVDTPTVATPVLLLNHDPPGVASVSVRVEPAQTDDTPLMLAGERLMVTAVVVKQPVESI